MPAEHAPHATHHAISAPRVVQPTAWPALLQRRSHLKARVSAIALDCSLLWERRDAVRSAHHRVLRVQTECARHALTVSGLTADCVSIRVRLELDPT